MSNNYNFSLNNKKVPELKPASPRNTNDYDFDLSAKNLKQEELITKIYEGRMVPKDLSEFEIGSLSDNAFIYLDYNGEPRRISWAEATKYITVVETLPENAYNGQIVFLKVAGVDKYKLYYYNVNQWKSLTIIIDSSEISYVDVESTLVSTNVKDALTELDSKIEEFPENVVNTINNKKGDLTFVVANHLSLDVASDGTFTITGVDIASAADMATALAGKQDKLSNQTAYTSKGTSTKVPQITTNNLGQVTNISEVDIAKTTLTDLGITASAQEINYTDGVTSNIQTQLNSKQSIIDFTHKLSSDLVDDTNKTNKFVTASEKTLIGTAIQPNDNISELNNDAGFTNASQVQAIVQNHHDSTKQDVIDSSHKLSADLISDGTTNKTVTQTEKNTWSGKQDALTTQTAYSAKGSGTKVPQITTNTLGQVTGITEVDITKTTLSDLGITATASELNTLDGITASTTELNYVDGVTSNIQTQLNAKEPADATILKRSSVINSVTINLTDFPLSAAQGKMLNERIDNVASIGKFLSIWNCTTGLPLSDPPGGVPYTYHTGDYYRVGPTAENTYVHTISLVNYSPILNLKYVNSSSVAITSWQELYNYVASQPDHRLTCIGQTDGYGNLNYLYAWTEMTKLQAIATQGVLTISSSDFISDTVTPAVNYKPEGSSFTGAASTTVETDTVKTSFVYYYDGTSWLMQSAGGSEGVEDVTVDNTSIVSGGVANITANNLPNLPASKITSGTFADARIASASIWNNKQNALVSGTNIKTINGNSILGSGNLSTITYEEV